MGSDEEPAAVDGASESYCSDGKSDAVDGASESHCSDSPAAKQNRAFLGHSDGIGNDSSNTHNRRLALIATCVLRAQCSETA